MSDRSGVASRLYDLLTQLGGMAPPVRLIAWDGSTAGTPDAPVLRVNSRKAVRRILWSPGELGLARAYIAGELDVDGDLVDVLRQLAEYATAVGPKLELSPVDRREILRTAVLVGAVGPSPRPPEEERLFVHERSPSTRERSAQAVRDPGGLALFADILGPTMAYSCAYFDNPDQNLDDAQNAKLERICSMLDLQPGQRLLDVGCGWGSLIVHAAQHHGVSAVGLVTSGDRADVVNSRLAELGLTGQVEVRLGIYSDVEDGPFDVVAAIEANEHVREEQLLDYAATIQNLLQPGGRLFQQQVTSRGGGSESGPTFMTTYVQPEDTLLPFGSLLNALDAVGLEVRSTDSLRDHYPLTLLAWLRNLESRWADAVRVSGEPRARVWRLILAATAVGFERSRISVHQTLAVRPYADGRSGLPLG